MHKVFISYHHEIDQNFKNTLVKVGEKHQLFIDMSVDTGEIPDDWDDQMIREKIRDEYLRDSTVTILLVGEETKGRKHIDWEVYSSMFDGKRNKKSGILVVNLPTINCTSFHSALGDEEKKLVYPGIDNWKTIKTRAEFEGRYPFMPERIIDNLLADEAYISVVPWERLTVENLSFLIGATFNIREQCTYDLRRPMRRINT